MTPRFQFRSFSTTTKFDVAYDRPPNVSYQIYCGYYRGITTTRIQPDMSHWEKIIKSNRFSNLPYHYISYSGVSSRHRFLLKLAIEDILNANAIDIYMPGDHRPVTELSKTLIEFEKYTNIVTSYYGDLEKHIEYTKEIKFPEHIKDTFQDVRNLTYSDESFDYIHCNHMLEHVYDYKKSINELYRVLRKGGTLIITIPIHLYQRNNIEWARPETNGEIKWIHQPSYHGVGDQFPVFWEFGIQVFYEVIEMLPNSEVFLENYIDYNIGVFNQGENIIRIKK